MIAKLLHFSALASSLQHWSRVMRSPEESRLKNSSSFNGLPAGNPIANIFVVIVGVLAIAASLVLGFFAFVIVGSLVLVMASVIGIRVWWLNRKLERRQGARQQPGETTPPGVIEGEFRVVADKDKDA